MCDLPPHEVWHYAHRHAHALTDATFCSSLSYKIADTDTMFPEIGLDDIRGYDGGEYSPQEDRTAAYIENMKAEAA